MNLQYCLATMILEGDVFVEHFEDQRLEDPALLDMISRIRVQHDPKLDEEATGPKPRDTIIEVRLRDGTLLHNRQNRYLMGFGEDDQAKSRVVDKFRRATEGVLDPSVGDEIIEICDDLMNLGDVKRLSALLGAA
jgi:2-methylcitrate dehydratase PrpD